MLRAPLSRSSVLTEFARGRAVMVAVKSGVHGGDTFFTEREASVYGPK
jgi:hypothetical protein